MHRSFAALRTTEELVHKCEALLRNRCKLAEYPVHFLFGVVVDKADAQEAAILFDPEALSEIEGVVVAVPGEDAAFAESLREFRGMMALDPDSEGRAALRNACGIASSI
jgi:hypothetical protein